MTMAIAEDKKRLATRVTAIQAVVLSGFVLLVGGFWFFQIAQHTKFKEMAESNHQRTLPLRAPRGVILDRHGRVLVENRDSLNISILREHSKNIERTIEVLAAVTGVDAGEIREIVARHRHEPCVPADRGDLGCDAGAGGGRQARRLEYELPDVVVQEVPTRQYPAESLAAHLIGYVGEANETQVGEGGFSLGTIVGQTGVEKIYNGLLMGQDGARKVVVNSLGREISDARRIDPVEGRRVKLTHRPGDAGSRGRGLPHARVLGLGDRPRPAQRRRADAGQPAGVRSERIRRRHRSRAYRALAQHDKLRPLQNRAIQGRYSPGSTFKLVVATAALEEGLITPSFRVNCPGGATFYGRYFQCHLRGGHGSVDLRHAIEKSCNVYFYTLGNMLGVDRIHKWADNLGLAGKSGIDLPNEQDSLVPSTEWKQRTRNEKWYAG